MPARFPAASVNAAATALPNIAYLSLHTADPGSTGANECTDAGYARQPISWSAVAGGVLTSSNGQTFTTLGTTAMTYFGLSSASTGGTYGGGGQLASPVTATTITTSAGGFTVTVTG